MREADRALAVAARLRRQRRRRAPAARSASRTARTAARPPTSSATLSGLCEISPSTQQEIGRHAALDELGIVLIEDRGRQRVGRLCRRSVVDAARRQRRGSECARDAADDRDARAASRRVRERRASDLLFDARGFAAEISQVIELGSANITTSFHLDLRDSGTVGLEHALYALAVRNLSHRKRRVESPVLASR